MRLLTPLLAAFLLAAPTARAQSDSAAVVGALERFFSAARTRDTSIVRVSFDSAARLTLLRPAPGGGVRLMILSGEQFVQAVAGGPGIDEPIRDLKVRVDGDLASVWAEYQVRANGVVSHCGFDAFHLVRRSGAWKILTIADTFRREGCGPMWK